MCVFRVKSRWSQFYFMLFEYSVAACSICVRSFDDCFRFILNVRSASPVCYQSIYLYYSICPGNTRDYAPTHPHNDVPAVRRQNETDDRHEWRGKIQKNLTGNLRCEKQNHHYLVIPYRVKGLHIIAVPSENVSTENWSDIFTQNVDSYSR